MKITDEMRACIRQAPDLGGVVLMIEDLAWLAPGLSPEAGRELAKAIFESAGYDTAGFQSLLPMYRLGYGVPTRTATQERQVPAE